MTWRAISARRYAKERLDKKVVSNGAYDGPAEFAADMRLVFDNCALYNSPDSDAGMAVLDIHPIKPPAGLTPSPATQSTLQLDSHPALPPNQTSSWTHTQPSHPINPPAGRLPSPPNQTFRWTHHQPTLAYSSTLLPSYLCSKRDSETGSRAPLTVTRPTASSSLTTRPTLNRVSPLFSLDARHSN